MTPWQVLGCARMPDGRELLLRGRDGEFEIRVDGRELMSTRAHGSEEALAELAFAELPGMENARVLLGGLGLGYTLRAALARLPRSAKVTVAELLPEIIAWNHGPLAALNGFALRDPRVCVRCADVTSLLEARYDAILLDTDNGPGELSCDANAALYGPASLARIGRALSGNGVLAVWSADPAAWFAASLASAGFRVRTTECPARAGQDGPMHTIFLATRSG